MSGYCSLQATSVPSSRVARCTWPRLAAAAAVWPKLANFDLPVRRPARPPCAGGRRSSPSAARWPAAATAPPHTPSGSASGMVERICATFISGPFSPPSIALQVLGMRRLVGLDAEHLGAGHPRGDAADRAGGAGEAPDLAEQRAAVRLAFGHQARSNSSMKPAMTSSPRRQNAGSEASRPNGASSSLCRLVPPARSISRYFRSKPGWPSWNTL